MPRINPADSFIPFLNQKENVVGRNKPFDFAQDRLAGRPARRTLEHVQLPFLG